jgi:tetratricopeptide (TPR) repeat protein
VSFNLSYQFGGPIAQPDAAALVSSAIELYLAGRPAEAEAACRRALALAPAHAEALHLLGVLHAERGDFAPAADCFRQAIDANAAAAKSWSALGTALNRLGRREEAVAALRRAVALAPDAAQGHFALGTVLQESGDAAEADACFRRAVLLHPGLIQPDNQLGEALQGLGLYVSCRPDSDFALRQHPEFGALLRQWLLHNAANNSGDIGRLYALMLNVKQVLAEGVPGEMAELGVYRGNSAAVLAHYARASGRQLYLFDTFEGFDARDLAGVDRDRDEDFTRTSRELVREVVGDEGVVYAQGHFPQSIPADIADRFAVVHLDCDLYAPMQAGLAFFYPRLAPGGLMLLHDYSSGYFPGAKQAIDEFVGTIPENLVLLPDKSGSAVIRKSAGGPMR